MVLEANALAAPHMTVGAQCYAAKDLTGALAAFQAAAEAQPDLTPAKFNLGIVYRDLEQNEESERWLREVLASGEIVADAYNNLGILAVRREEFETGVELFRRAIAQRQDFPLARFNLGTLLLRLGQWQEGFREYEWRWQTPSFTPLQCPQPQWDGQSLEGALLLHTEQGIGDVFQFARFIPEIRRRCQKVIFVRPESMACMFNGEPWGDEVRSPGEIELSSFQATLPLMSAPHVLQFDINQLPLAENYLTPEPRDVPLGPCHVPDAELRVGFAWCGSPTHVNDAFRSMPATCLLPLFQLPGVAFYSLQLGERIGEIQSIAESNPSVRDLSGQQNDFADTAAIAKQLDLIVTVDTSVLHLGGAMGIPTWGLLSRRSDWRWLDNDHADTPWYPSVRLYRQATLNDWDEVIERVREDLAESLDV